MTKFNQLLTYSKTMWIQIIKKFSFINEYFLKIEPYHVKFMLFIWVSLSLIKFNELFNLHGEEYFNYMFSDIGDFIMLLPLHIIILIETVFNTITLCTIWVLSTDFSNVTDLSYSDTCKLVEFDFCKYFILPHFCYVFVIILKIINFILGLDVLLHKYPIFLMFGLLFLFTTIFSLICLSYLGLYGVFILNLVSISLFWLSMIYYFNIIMSNSYLYFINLGKWMHLSHNFKISFELLIDTVSISFSFLTLTIGFFVYIYTFSYFRYEPLVERLMLFLNLFMISMILLVSSGNFIVMFLGWELIGLTSFFLINFWSTRAGTLKSAFKAFSFNKVSDFFLFFAIILIYNMTFNLDILTFNNHIHLYENYSISILNYDLNLIEVISFFFISCAFIKSAQIGGHLWLPDSMEAPIPASALIHSATLVSAGIYLLLRLNPLFNLSIYAFYVIPFVGSLTALYGGLVSAFQSDTKKTLAYSTISHCGFLMVAYSTGVLEFVILYLYVHGFFKAATFLCIGNVNRFSRNIQDFKRMGGFYKYLPFECFTTFICIMNLSGLPLTLGFYTKHLLFIGLNESYYFYYMMLSFLILGATAGVFYSYRLFYSIFFDTKKGKKTIYNSASRSNLNSKFYSNTSLASNITISALVIVSYITILYLYNITLNKFYSVSDLKTNTINNSYAYYFNADLNYLNAISILNWLIIMLIITTIFINWRRTKFYSKSVDSLSKFILFSFIFYVMSKYIL